MQYKTSLLSEDEYFHISPEGVARLVEQNNRLNFDWTTDCTMELPIRMKRKGPGKK
jgi:hypothetical protein